MLLIELVNQAPVAELFQQVIAYAVVGFVVLASSYEAQVVLQVTVDLS